MKIFSKIYIIVAFLFVHMTASSQISLEDEMFITLPFKGKVIPSNNSSFRKEFNFSKNFEKFSIEILGESEYDSNISISYPKEIGYTPHIFDASSLSLGTLFEWDENINISGNLKLLKLKPHAADLLTSNFLTFNMGIVYNHDYGTFSVGLENLLSYTKESVDETIVNAFSYSKTKIKRVFRLGYHISKEMWLFNLKGKREVEIELRNLYDQNSKLLNLGKISMMAGCNFNTPHWRYKIRRFSFGMGLKAGDPIAILSINILKINISYIPYIIDDKSSFEISLSL